MAMGKRERIIAVVAGLVVGALVLDRLFITPWLERWDIARTRAAAAERELEDARQTIDNDLRAQRNWRDMSGGTVQSDAAAAESQVLNRVRNWAQDAGLSLTSIKPEAAVPQKGYQRVTIRATATGSMRNVARFLFAVENADVPLRVSDMQIVTRREGTDDLTLQVGLATIYLPSGTATEAPR
jgi:hypothetical protein